MVFVLPISVFIFLSLINFTSVIMWVKALKQSMVVHDDDDDGHDFCSCR